MAPSTLLRRLLRRSSHPPAASPGADDMRRFRADVRRALEDGTREDVGRLRQEIEGSGWDAEEFEVEREILDARDAVLDLEVRLGQGDLPACVTQHRAVVNECCRFLAPVSVHTDAGEASGKLFLTDLRLRVVGGRTLAVGWGAVRSLRPMERDLLVETSAGTHTVRCNTFGDARVAARLGAALMERGRSSSRQPGA